MKPFTVQLYFKKNMSFLPNHQQRFQFKDEKCARRFAKNESMWEDTESASLMFMGSLLETYEQGDLVFLPGYLLGGNA